MRILTFIFISTLSLNSFAGFSSEGINFSKVAVVVYGQNALAKKYARTAFTRLENILLDNGVEVLDQQKAKDLKNIWKQLEDPGFFVTAETFVENTEKYSVDGIIRVYLTTDAVESWGKSFSSTAIADIRFVDSEANVNAFATIPMGIPGKPPSDGLTKSAAIVNAIQRSIDESSSKLGLEIIDYANPRTIKFKLSEVSKPARDTRSLRIKHPDTSFDKYVPKSERKTIHEDFSCHTIDPGEVLGAAGGYLKITGFGKRNYASKLHVIDLSENKEILVFDTSLSDRKHKWERGARKLQDCMFIHNWRYLLGLTGNHISLWDTERGVNMSEIHIKEGIKRGGKLDYISDGTEEYIVVNKKGKPIKYFEIIR